MDFLGPIEQSTRKYLSFQARVGIGDALAQNPVIDPISKIYFESRPWGNFTQYTHNQLSTVKIIKVNRGEILSLQLHHSRDELWVALDEGIIAEAAGKKHLLKVGETLFVPRETKHRLSSSQDARVLEIAFGEFDENDIVRFEDKYGREKTK